MRIWLISFGLLFGAVELYQWFAALNVPMPIYIACGIALAIASNSSKPSDTISNPQKMNFVNPQNISEVDARVAKSLPPTQISFKIEPPTWKKKTAPSD
ncbi:hypothetical protein [Oscillatoria sp. FACHB-1406]|uniref:hypothetical protein n=1 Tax=Oscillatoria sp. FACHB-1406 TaxID=2692846 RepID=UPI001687A68D|nr:hypothetical protein [Oscillatoria sp. FACHB-1406]MBD2577416.1 hypothetical protein [Oscillatoria sp. FACHB-1406]